MISELAFGKTHGCFEKPRESKPNTDIDCPDILPLQYSEAVPNEKAMSNASPLVHPDTRNLTRYCLGTRLQMKDQNKSHKLPTCKYHDADNAKQGKFLKTMSQEALQILTCCMTFVELLGR